MRLVVIDTNILVSALWSNDGNPFKIVEMIFTNEITPCLNSDILDEYSEVLHRKKLGFPAGKVKDLLGEITKNGIFLSSDKSTIKFVDESDRKFFDLAKSNNAVLITGNIKHYPLEQFVLNPHDYLLLCRIP